MELNTEKTSAEVFTYSLKEDADFTTINLHLDAEDACYRFDLKTPDGIIANFK